jgi:hypothetical protein
MARISFEWLGRIQRRAVVNMAATFSFHKSSDFPHKLSNCQLLNKDYVASNCSSCCRSGCLLCACSQVIFFLSIYWHNLSFIFNFNSRYSNPQQTELKRRLYANRETTGLALIRSRVWIRPLSPITNMKTSKYLSAGLKQPVRTTSA